MAVRPGGAATEPFALFISESGAGRIIRWTSDKPGETAAVITGFPTSTNFMGPRIGPLGLDFPAKVKSKLAVGTGGLDDGKDLVQVYALPEDGTALTYEQVDHSVGPVPAGKRSATGEGDFFGLASSETALYVASGGDDDQGWVLKARISANKLNDLQPFIATRKLSGASGPMGIAINPKPRAHHLVVGKMGQSDDQRDSLITFYGPSSGELAINLQTGLFDITGLAYSPRSAPEIGDLYAIDFSWADPEQGGVYRIDAARVDGRESCRAVKIAVATRPTALAFTPDGVLYVTAFGDRKSADDAPTGVLLKISPAPGTPKL